MGNFLNYFCNAEEDDVSINCRFVDDDMTCAICLVEEIPSKCYLKPCGHLFHRKCLNKWFYVSTNRRCPYCQQEVSKMIDIK